VSVATCPSCGAPIEFAIGSSAVVVCTYCQSVVARTDRGIESHGRVAALIDTGSPLTIGVTGRHQGQGFRITGRTQLRHQAGGVWDEWYASFDDGRWGWLAEAQGRFYVTFRVGAEAPSLEQLQLGSPIGALEGLVVAEIGEARIASAEGELPWKPEPDRTYPYADLTGPERRFATIDYSEEPPIVFKGVETTLEELGIRGEAARRSRVQTTALNCSKCGGALTLHAPDQAERVWCPYCGAGHDVVQSKLRYFGELKVKKGVEPAIALGSSGTIDGDAYVVAGFMQRSVRFDRTYYWTEYLLYNAAKSYRWLVHSDDHWSFVTPLRPGEVIEGRRSVVHEGRSYRLFQQATANVTYVLGEFYWRVAVGEQVDTSDYIAPPFGISKEVTTSGAKEIAYSHARYLQPQEVEKAFALSDLPRPTTIGPMQPPPVASVTKLWLTLVALLIVTAMVISVRLARRVVLERTYDVANLAPSEGAPANGRMLFSEPFELSGEHNVAIEAETPINNSWMYIGGDLVNERTGRLDSFDLPLEYYSGVDSGESWSEGKRKRRVYLSRPDAGAHVLRLSAEWEEGKLPPALRVTIREGVFRFSHFLAALVALSIAPLLTTIRRVKWEAERWSDSAFTPFGQIRSTDESDDDEEE
jgi:hypothetical protein